MIKKKFNNAVFFVITVAVLAGVFGCGGENAAADSVNVVFQNVDEMKVVFADRDVRVRAYYYPTTQSEVYRTLEAGEEIRVAGMSSDWICMEENGSRFYILSDMTVETPPDSDENGKAEEEDGLTKTAEDATGGQTGANEPGAGEEGASKEVETIRESMVSLTPDMKYAEFSAIHEGQAKLYDNYMENRKGITVCVNAGHGTEGGSAVKTQCHPDGTPKVTGGTTKAGETRAIAVSSGMTFLDGTAEQIVTLRTAEKLRDKLLAEGYSVLMIRESEDIQLDNVARTVLANIYADCHVALHWDATESDKGAFYMAVPSVESYRKMEPVASTWEKSERFGGCLIDGLKAAGRKIYGDGSMEMDLTQTSYSSIPSMDIELGDKASDYSDENLEQIADGLLLGINLYFER